MYMKLTREIFLLLSSVDVNMILVMESVLL